MDPRIAGIEELLCDESFQQYCRGENRSDILFWEKWIRENPDKEPIVAGARRLYGLLSLGQGNRLEQLSALKEAVDRRAYLQQELLSRQESDNTMPAPVMKLRRKPWLKYAASILILITAGLLAYLKYGSRALAHPANYEYYTGLHDRKTILLPDSTVVMLNENSRLLINRDFDAHHRQVTITGEAFFDVQHDAAHPFLVNTTQYTIRVLGTTFNVRSYPGKDTTETTLLTGKIEIIRDTTGGKAEQKIVLKPNEKFMLTAVAAGTGAQPDRQPPLNKGEVIKPVMDTASRRLTETSWARNKMEIKDRTLGEIAIQLEAWYGIAIRFADDTVKSYRYTATFDDETIISVLRYLQQSYPFSYTIKDDCIVIATN